MSEAEQEPQKSKKPAYLEKLEMYLEEQRKKVTIDDTDVNSHFISQAPNYLSASIRWHKAVQVLQQQKANLETVTSEVDLEIRSGGEKTTEAFITQAVKRHERVINARNALIQAEYQASCYQSVVRSWEQKKDMLIQVGSDQRREFNSQASLNKGVNGDGTTQERRVNGRETRL